LAPTFFGLNSEHREVFLEEAFLLQYHLKMPYGDIRSLPLPYRRWFIKRLSDEFKKRAEAQKKASDDNKGLVDIPMGEVMDSMMQPGSPRPSGPPQPGQPRTFKFNKE
tara:strand:+ start:171 stop:494 length:324 start_codon:yes stop_codon:yes gene_type:complete